MDALELRNTRKELAEWVNNLSDVGLLQLLNSIKLSIKGSNNDWWNDLNESEKKNIRLGLKDLESCKTMTSEGFWKHLSDE